MQKVKTVLLSFDIEEFDMPLEYGRSISLPEQIEVSKTGTSIILEMLNRHKVKATFFSTVVFAKHAPELIQRLTSDGHELSSHGYYHSKFDESHLAESKNELMKLSGQPVNGFRMARMMPVSEDAVKDGGYLYNSSLNPVYLPGRYNNFFKPRTTFSRNGMIHFPASATPTIRFPLFWLSFHNLPQGLYRAACKRTINKDGYLNIYFHPWEFTDLTLSKYGFPRYVSKNSGQSMINRFDEWISWLKDQGYTFNTISNFLLPEKG